jgi:peptidoglycan/xylan/chitin deacetylase (PgdA/CDA1 family)
VYLRKKIILYIKNIFKIFCFIIYYSRFYRIISYFQRNQAIILVYHSINIKNNPNIYPDNIITYESYKQQIEYLKKSYQIIPLIELVKILEKREKIPSRTVCLTFDDGYKDFIDQAFPILVNNEIPATLFPITGHLEAGKSKWEDELTNRIQTYGKNHLHISIQGEKQVFNLSTQEHRLDCIRELNRRMQNMSHTKRVHLLQRISSNTVCQQIIIKTHELKKICFYDGITIGCHTHTHKNLATLDIKQLEYEVIKSKKLIKEITGEECILFSYPFGQKKNYNNDVKRILLNNGFRAAVTTIRGRVSKKSNLYELRRIAAIDDASYLFICSLIGLTLQR